MERVQLRWEVFRRFSGSFDVGAGECFCYALSLDFETMTIGERICVHDELSVNEHFWA